MTDNTSLQLMTEDLAKSGLKFEDVFTRIMGAPEKNLLGVVGSGEGYVIPYYDMYGKMLPYYRARMFTGENKYRQVKSTPNHVYFPPKFREVFKRTGGKMLILTEGEKKAALACKLGFPAVAFGGVDSWSNKILLLPKTAEITSYSHNRTMVAAKLPSATFDEANMSTLAMGFQELLDVCLKQKTTFYIIYDSEGRGLTSQAQRAAARLGYELRYRGFNIGQIRQIVLPDLEDDDNYDEIKVGLDDFLMSSEGGVDGLAELVKECLAKPSAFPRHPNIREHINRQLQKPKLDRKQTQNLSLSVITELDGRGKRMYSKAQQQLFYFDGTSKSLMKVTVNDGELQAMQETGFGRLLYRDYGISPSADNRLMQWFGSQFAAEDPVADVDPKRVICQPSPGEDICRLQINDGEYIAVGAYGWKIVPNGTNGILFESDHVEPLDAQKLRHELAKREREPLECWWQEVFKGVRLKDRGESAIIATLLYYMSPYLNRWRGTQLPVELICGEAGSGKSTLMEIRLNILTGDAKLRNIPEDLKSWNAAIANSGGLHVTDNVHLVDKALKQRISDELCRLVTDPIPRVEMRKYYTEADIRVIHISAVFAFTAIHQPFLNADLLQRAFVMDLDKSVKELKDGTFSFDSHWKDTQISRYGGRVAWVAHHINVLQRFFKLVEQKWDNNYKSKHRLVNFEQSLMLMAEVFGIENNWISEFLMYQNNSTVGRADWVLEGLLEWVAAQRSKAGWETKEFSTQEMANWAMSTEDFEKNQTLISSRSLGKWMQSNKHNLAMIVGMEESRKKNNKQWYRILMPPKMYEFAKPVTKPLLGAPGGT